MAIGGNLQDVSATLESLCLDIDQDIRYRLQSGLGGLQCFSALKHLSVQSNILIGDFGFYLDDDLDYIDERTLARLLPPSLQTLQLSCWFDGNLDDAQAWGIVIPSLLTCLIRGHLEIFPDLQDITIYYPPLPYPAYLTENPPFSEMAEPDSG